ncbi:MAG: membrane lipoprotein lipid attachment site-containing protein [Anaerolineales bacterium]|nr:membrane lipoprotein lipid attachment site-containing protein [Anaerolineales bacterium]
MKKFILFIVMATLVLAACGGSEPPIEERIIGTWSGLQTAASGDKVPATWQFLEGGTMVVSVGGFSYGAEWSIEGSRVNIVTEVAPDDPTYRDIEFVSDDVMKLTKEDIEETWSRVE